MEISLEYLIIEEKLKLIEIIWNDLLKTEHAISSLEWHKEELSLREKELKWEKKRFWIGEKQKYGKELIHSVRL